MTDPAPDFDAEKRRRRYAAWFGCVGSTTLLAVLLIRLLLEGVLRELKDDVWQVVPAMLGVWLFLAVLKYVAAYALWYKPYASRTRAVVLSLCATLVVYLGLFGGTTVLFILKDVDIDVRELAKQIWEFHVTIYGLTYVAAAGVGWRFARPAPDVRESF